MKLTVLFLFLTAPLALALTPPQTLRLAPGLTLSASQRDTLHLGRTTWQWAMGENSLCPSITDPSKDIDCVRQGSLELIFTQKVGGRTSRFTLVYGDDAVLEQQVGHYRLKVLGVTFPVPAPAGTSCPPEVTVQITLEKLRGKS